MGEVKFRNNKYYGNVNDAYSDFIQNLAEASDKVAHAKIIKIRRNSPEWFDRNFRKVYNTRQTLQKIQNT